MKRHRAPLAFVLALAWRAAVAQELEVIDLHHRLADDVIPVIEPLLAPGGVLTGMDDKLFVRTSAANLEQIRMALAAIDVEARQLLISVGQSSRSESHGAGARASASVGGDDAQVGVNRPPVAGTGADVQLHAGMRSTGVRSLGSVRALEGQEAYLAVGQSPSVTSSVVSPGWGQPGVRRTTTYRDAGSGFYAMARVQGERVTVEVSPFQQAGSGSLRPGAEIRSINTRVSGRLGEWIPLGAVTETATGSERGLLVLGGQKSSSDYVAWIKVDEIP
jgi:type II secretory pathway component GspD/PulD (secretin)